MFWWWFEDCFNGVPKKDASFTEDTNILNTDDDYCIFTPKNGLQGKLHEGEKKRKNNFGNQFV